MTLLKKWLKKREAKKKAKQPKMSGELMAFGYETLLEFFIHAMNPDHYKVNENDNGFYIEKDTDGEWKRYFAAGNAKKPGHFLTFDDAIKAIEGVISKAAKDFDDTIKSIEGYEED